MVEKAARGTVTYIDDGRGQHQGDESDEGLEDDENDGQKQSEVFADMKAREERNMDRHSCSRCVRACRRKILTKRSTVDHEPGKVSGLGEDFAMGMG